MGFFIILIICYILGLICFAIGRGIGKTFRCCYRHWKSNVKNNRIKKFLNISCNSINNNKNNINKKMNDPFRRIVEAHGLFNLNEFKYYSEDNQRELMKLLYQRMWSEVRQSPDLMQSCKLLTKWWVMAATYDGLAFGLILWSFIVGGWTRGWWINKELYPTFFISYQLGIFCIIMLLVLSITSFRESGRLQRNQMEELAATIAYKYHDDIKKNTFNDKRA